MICGLVYSPNRQLLAVVCRLFADCAGEYTSHHMRMVACANEKDLDQALQEAVDWAFSCVDIGGGEGMGTVRTIRASCPHVELMLVVGEGVSPMEYIVPGIMPSGLVQMPARAERVRSAVREFVAYVLRRAGDNTDAQSFVLETREGKTRIPYSSICCFESKAKRIAVRLRREEYSYYDTLDRLQKALPSNFLRCHRSYIVNREHVTRLVLSESAIIMDDETRVPVSRTYRAKVREAIQ